MHRLSTSARPLLTALLLAGLAACPRATERPDHVDPTPPPQGGLYSDVAPPPVIEDQEALTALVEKYRTSLETGPADSLYKDAEEAEEKQNHKDAAELYARFAFHHRQDPRALHATERASQNWFRMQEYDEGLRFFGAVAFSTKAPANQARLYRVLGNLYLAVPHWGMERGGTFHRGKSGQGKWVQSHRTDRTHAIYFLERARTLVADATDIPPAERMAVRVDLITAIAKFTPYDSTWTNHWYAWGDEVSDGLEDEEGEDELGGRGHRQNQPRPQGLEVSPSGEVVFDPLPAAYDPDLTDTGKIKFLLQEMRAKDATPEKTFTGESWLLQALLFQARDGAARIQNLQWYWYGGSYPYKEQIENHSNHELRENEAFGLVGTSLRVYEVPDDEAAPKLLAQAHRDAPKSAAGQEALFLLGRFYQGRAQYGAALEAYDTYAKAYPSGRFKGSAESEARSIRAPDFAFLPTGVRAAGEQPSLEVTHRNIESVTVRIRRVDEKKAVQAFEAAYKSGNPNRMNRHARPDQLGWNLVSDYDGSIARLASEVVGTHQVSLPATPDHRAVKTMVRLPVQKPGTYVLEVDEVGESTVHRRGIISLVPYALVKKNTAQGPIHWVVDAKTGAPVKGAKVKLFEYWQEYKNRTSTLHHKVHRATTDKDGLASAPGLQHQALTTVTLGDKVAYAGLNYWWYGYHPTQVQGRRYTAAVLTDRPVYRPGDKVDLTAWARLAVDGSYRPATDVKRLRLIARDPEGKQVLDTTVDASAFGAGSGSLTLAGDAPLGLYSIQVSVDGSGANTAGAAFRVEEYKAPEYTVTVKSGDSARLGEKVEAKIEAEYLFGGPVTDAEVTYKVMREDHTMDLSFPGPWDWLYGRGYGGCFHHYHWLTWWDVYGPAPVVWYPWWGPPPKPAQELLKEGKGRLDDKGQLLVEVDTASLKADLGKRDHRLVIKAEVRDLSRRIIKGEGSIALTRTGYLAAVQVVRPWSSRGEQVDVRVQTRNADGSPAQKVGRVEFATLERAPDGRVSETVVDTLDVTTDADGFARVSYRSKTTGQYRVSFVGQDDRGQEVRASTITWVVGPKFRGKKQRMAGLELWLDQRTYKPGDTAKLLIQSEQENAAVLLATKVDQGLLVDYRVLRLPGKTTVVDIPVDEAAVPNLFVEATLVTGGVLYQEAREVLVPPQNSELNVTVTADAAEYRPGKKAKLTIKTTDANGRPVPAEVALTMFDKSVLYIQPELLGDVRAHFWAQKRTHNVQSESNLNRDLPVHGTIANPAQSATWALFHRLQGYFQMEGNWRYGNEGGVKGTAELAEGRRDSAGDDDLEKDGAGFGGGGKKEKRSRRAESKSSALGAVAADAAPMEESEAAPAAKPAPRRQAANKAPAAPPPPPGGGEAAAPAEKPRVRRDFRGTAGFVSSVKTGKSGTATVTIDLPDNLTTWSVRAVGFDGQTRIGEGRLERKTTQPLLVRVETPRFFREKDRVLLTAIIHNHSDKDQTVKTSWTLQKALLRPEGKLSGTVKVKAHGEQKVELWVDVTGEGLAPVLFEAQGKGMGDAKELTVPVLLYGAQKQVAGVGSLRADDASGEARLVIDVPAERRSDRSWLSIRYSPTLAGAMLDALPYLLDYPYGCTEQTLSRFVPAVLTRRALQQAGGKSLEELAQDMANLNPGSLSKGAKQDEVEAARRYKRFQRSPVFSTAVLDDIVATGLRRLAGMQNRDGGWGWWGRDGSSRYTTAHVLNGLLDAREADLAMPGHLIGRGQNALRNLVQQSLWRYDEHEWVSDEDAFAAYVMARLGEQNDQLLGYLWDRRAKLSRSGKLYAALAFHLRQDTKKADVLLENVEQFRKRDDENQTTWLEGENAGWWYWYNRDTETNALYLRTLDTMRKGSDDAPRVVKWLLAHRAHATYWHSTRDTAQIVAAMANHMQVSQERRVDYDLEVLLDGKVLKTVHIDKTNLLTFDGEVRLEGQDVPTGQHTITFRRKGSGAVYFNTFLSYFSTEDKIEGTGLEIKVERKYSKLIRQDREHQTTGDRGQRRVAREVAYRKVPLADGDLVTSGDLVLVELFVTSKNDYTFLAIEDPKPAGLETVALRSGHTYGEAVANMELRDEQTVFFLRRLDRGTLKLSYRLYAQIPGTFHAMPTHAYGMYAPELDSISDSFVLKVAD